MNGISNNTRPSFLITVDTECDNLWSSSDKITTENSKYISRFQRLCEKYQLRPTYLVDYDMANCPIFRALAKGLIANGAAEIGMHLHSWRTPPEYKITDCDAKYKPYLTEFPVEIMDKKIKYMTMILEDVFGVKVVSHRAGRWDLNEQYVEILEKYGYKIDCSVTPHVTWKNSPGLPGGSGGADYRGFHDYGYFMDKDDISKISNSGILELPVSIINQSSKIVDQIRKVPVISRFANKMNPRVIWLRPNGKNLKHMKKIIRKSIYEKKGYIEFMIHSSELMPSGSPTFKTISSINKLYSDLEKLYFFAENIFTGRTLNEHYMKYFEDKERSPYETDGNDAIEG